MIEALSPLFVGELADLRDKLLLAGDQEADLPGSALLQPAVLQGLLARFARKYPNPDIKAVASLWSKWHFSVVVTPIVAADMLANYKLPSDLGDLGIMLAPEGRTAAVVLPHQGGPADPADAFERFGPLLENHLEPLILALSAESGASPRVFWSNLGNLLENIVRRAEAGLGEPTSGLVHARALLGSREWPGRRSNPLFEPVRYIADAAGETHRRRRVCCIRYLIQDLGYCATCPLVRPVRPS